MIKLFFQFSPCRGRLFCETFSWAGPELSFLLLYFVKGELNPCFWDIEDALRAKVAFVHLFPLWILLLIFLEFSYHLHTSTMLLREGFDILSRLLLISSGIIVPNNVIILFTEIWVPILILQHFFLIEKFYLHKLILLTWIYKPPLNETGFMYHLGLYMMDFL